MPSSLQLPRSVGAGCALVALLSLGVACNSAAGLDELMFGAGAGSGGLGGAGGGAGEGGVAGGGAGGSGAAGGGAGGMPPSYTDVVRKDNPIAYWRLGESLPPVAVDDSGSFDGTYFGTVTLGEPALAAHTNDTAVTFGGYVFASGLPSFAGNASFSVEVWLRPAMPPGGVAGIAGREGDNSVGGYLLYLSGGGHLTFRRGTGTSPDDAIGGTVIEQGMIAHAVGTYNGQQMLLYVNGFIDGSSSSTQALMDPGVDFAIARRTVLNNYFEGTIDEVALYSYALTAQQVGVHYAAGID